MEDFEWLLDFLKRSGENQVRLIGGEPTLHPQFIKFVLKQTFTPWIENIHVFTNGTFDEDILQILFLQSYHKSVSLLVNYNKLPKVLDNKIKRNLDILSKKKEIKLTIGINIYDPKQDFDYFIETQRMFGIKNIRWTIVSPYIKLKDENSEVDMFKHFKYILPQQERFLYQQQEQGLETHPDCNTIPTCLHTDKFLRDMQILNPSNIEHRGCEPVIDVLSDMTQIRCFMFSDFPVDIKQFETVQEVREYFKKTIDQKLDGFIYKKSCEYCQFYQKYRTSCGCKQFHFLKVFKRGGND